MRWIYDTPEGPRDATPAEIAKHAELASMAGAREYLTRVVERELKAELGGKHD